MRETQGGATAVTWARDLDVQWLDREWRAQLVLTSNFGRRGDNGRAWDRSRPVASGFLVSYLAFSQAFSRNGEAGKKTTICGKR